MKIYFSYRPIYSLLFIYIYIYIYCGGLKNHTTVLSEVNSPEGEFIEQIKGASNVSAGGVQCLLPLWCWRPFLPR